ncbi:MAG: hypothetical protein LBT55_00655 [Clostridiaceae bacterium]|jgi:hypothetical protein|nr:hypothetical protein [Clostridiaceae bacterium]
MINYDDIKKVIYDLEKYVEGLKSVSQTQSSLEKSIERLSEIRQIIAKSSDVQIEMKRSLLENIEKLAKIKGEIDSLSRELQLFTKIASQAEQARNQVISAGLSAINSKTECFIVELQKVDGNIAKHLNIIEERQKESEKSANKKQKFTLGCIIGFGIITIILTIVGIFS